MTKTGLESLTQRGKTPLFLELTQLFDQVFNALDASKVDDVETLWSVLNDTVGFSAKFKSLVLKYMNIPLSRVLVDESIVTNLYCMVSVLETTKKTVTTLSAGTALATLNRHYDDKTASIDVDAFRQSPVRFSVCITSSCWLNKTKDGRRYFTGVELAAISLHELGHIDELIRAGYRSNTQMIDACDIVDYVKTQQDRAFITALLTALKKSTKLDKSWVPVVKALDKFFAETNDLNNDLYFEALNTLCVLVVSDTAGRNLFTANDLILGSDEKFWTTTQLVDRERNADEFAARNGAYADLVSGNAKMHSLDTTHSDVELRIKMWSEAAVVFGMLRSFITLFYLPSENIRNGYDPIIKRLSLTVETAKHAFVDVHLPDEVKAEIKLQIQQAEEYIKQYQSSAHYKVRSEIKRWKDNVAHFGRLVKSPFTDRLMSDYTRLQNDTRSLSRHPLYYLANK